MSRYRQPWKLSTFAAAAFLTGCGTYVSVRVERLAVDDQTMQLTTPVPSPATVQAVTDSIGLLQDYENRVLQPAIVTYELKSSTQPAGLAGMVDAIMRDAIQSEVTRIDALILKGETIVHKMSETQTQLLQAQSEPVGKKSREYPDPQKAHAIAVATALDAYKDTLVDARLYPITVRNAVPTGRVASLYALVAPTTRPVSPDQAQRDAYEVANRIRLRAESAENKASEPAFGGFVTHAVYEISPGDPAYASVLKGHVLGDPFTHVLTGAQGNSNILIVQESPGQMRFLSLDADATRLIQNVIAISDKALEAAVKYAKP